jgi:hypothetical protein
MKKKSTPKKSPSPALSIGQTVRWKDQLGIVVDLAADGELVQLAISSPHVPKDEAGNQHPHFSHEAIGLTQPRVWIRTRVVDVPIKEVKPID